VISSHPLKPSRYDEARLNACTTTEVRLNPDTTEIQKHRTRSRYDASIVARV